MSQTPHSAPPVPDAVPAPDSNPDLITGAPGSHPVGTGLGAAAAGTAGAAIGAFAGPVGAIAGAVVGAVVGGLGGKGAAEAIDPTAEDAYWRENHRSPEGAAVGRTYDDYAPAYRAGYSGYRDGETFAQREEALKADYAKAVSVDDASVPGSMPNAMSTRPVQWSEASAPARAAYDRVAARRAAGSINPPA